MRQRPEVPGYELGEVLGRGATSTCWAARRVRDGAPFAVKVGHADADARQLRRELMVLAQVVHPHVLAIREVIPLPADRLAIVQDLADGGTLEQLVAARGHLTPGEIVTVLAPCAEAVAFLHASGVVHADLSPANVVFDSAGRPLVGDLGAARVFGDVHDERYGTDGFIAPEVRYADQPVAASDVWSLGALGWHALTGRTVEAFQDLGALDDLAPDAPSDLRALIVACLAAEPSERPAAQGLATRLFEACDPTPVELGDRSASATLVTHRLRALAAQAPPTRRLRRPTTWRDRVLPVAVVLVGGLGLGSAVGWAAFGAGRQILTVGAPSGAQSPVVPAAGAPAPTSTSTSPATTTPTPTKTSTPRPKPSTPAATQPAAAAPPATPPAKPAVPTRWRTTEQAPRTAPTALLQELFADRAGAIEARSSTALSRVDVPGSQAAQQDEAIVSALQARKQRLADVGYRVAQVSTRSLRGDTAVVRATVSLTDFRWIGPDGVARPHAAVPSALSDYTLTWTDAGWRLRTITAVG